MMVQRKGPNSYQVQVRGLDGRVQTFTFRRREDAERKERALKDEKQLMRAGLELPPSSELLIDELARWMRKREKDGTAPGTTARDEERSRLYVLPALGHLPVSSVTTTMVQRLLDDAQEQHALSNATRNRIRALLHKFYNDLFKAGRVAANPVSRVALLKEQPKRKAPLTAAAVEAFIAECYSLNPITGFCAVVFLYEGIRISEALGLQVRDFDLERGELHIRRMQDQQTKTVKEGRKGHGDGLVLPLFPRVRRAFLEHLKRTPYRAPTDFVIHQDSGQPVTNYGMKSRIRHVAEKHGMSFGPHALRATFATLAEEAGYTREDLQRMLGHTSPVVTQIYVRRTAAPLLEKGARLGFGSDASQSADRALTAGRKRRHLEPSRASKKNSRKPRPSRQVGKK